MSSVDDLERLHRLREAGALTAEEFDAEKAKLLATGKRPAGLVNTPTFWIGVAADAGEGGPLTSLMALVSRGLVVHMSAFSRGPEPCLGYASNEDGCAR